MKNCNSAASAADVLLVSLPWAPLDEPSLGLGILSSTLNKAGIHCQVKHLNIQLLRYLKWSTYTGIAGDYGLNDYLFTGRMDPHAPTEHQTRAIASWAQVNASREKTEYRPPEDEEQVKTYVKTLRDVISIDYLAECVDEIIASRASVIGFSCMYDQTISSLALARLIKDCDPSVFVIFGGYAVSSPTGERLMDSFDCIDAICYGEGEAKIVDLVSGAQDRTSLASIDGISYRDPDGKIHHNQPSSSWIDLNNSPAPDYSDFFNDLTNLKKRDGITIHVDTLPVESSRGCWWGQKSHCVFCGIHKKDLEYRYKRPEIVMRMLDDLSEKHHITHFRFSDYILPNQYFKTLLPQLKQHPKSYSLHWEIKANLSLDKIRLLQQAGVSDLQPGIESFATPLLKKMAKGVTGIQNVYTVKMLTQHRINVHYNILYGFPDETSMDHIDHCNLIPRLHHLKPPTTFEKISTTRFSPIYNQYGKLSSLKADSSYQVVFSDQFLNDTGFTLEDYAYMFRRPFHLLPENKKLYSILVFRLTHWCQKAERNSAVLYFRAGEEGIYFFDSRTRERGEHHHLDRLARDVCLAIGDELVRRNSLYETFSGTYPPAQVDTSLAELLRRGLIHEENQKIMNLAFPADFYTQAVQGQAALVQTG